jgi:hypothetical protein
MTPLRNRSTRVMLIAIALLPPARAFAQADVQPAPPPEPEESSFGLPSQIEWKFNFDAGWGGFGFGNSLYTGPKEGVKTTYGSNWMEGFAKPALSATYKLKSTSEVYGKLSVVGERTYASPPELVGRDESSFLPEDLSIGWRSGKMFEGLGENALDFTVGRAPFTLGHGMLLWDGAAEGGTRGGYWSNARKDFAFAAIARFKTAHHTLESFYLKKDDLPEHETGTRLWGANYEFKVGESSTFGATYMKFWAKPEIDPGRNELNVYNLRAYTAPFPKAKDLSFDLEYAAERNGDALHSDAWTAQAAYQLSTVAWKPKFTYRYAFFEGDNPATPQNEAFDPLLLGFYDWGSWWQGEIAGEYFLVNSNLKSHLVRAHVSPSDSVGSGLIFYKFLLDQPTSYAPGVTDPNLAIELDAYTDWKINKHFTASFVLAFADPQRAVQQSSNRTQNFRYGMVFLAYSY